MALGKIFCVLMSCSDAKESDERAYVCELLSGIH